MKQYKPSLLLTAVSLLLSFAVFSSLPEQIPAHWNTQGAIDRYAPKLIIFLFPVFIFLMTVLFQAMRRTDPNSGNYKKFQKEYNRYNFVIGLVFFAVQIMTIAAAFRIDFNVNLIFCLGIGSLFIFLGNLLPKTKHNYFIGIRTPWALADEQNWFRTHRFTGKLWVTGGLVTALAALAPASLQVPVFLSVLAVIVIVPFIFSYLQFRKKQ
ncbi:SdpI family protein [Anaerostipes sp.]|uniref:SdpI family protein n=1 Tax=Anaerostipes sp. TaxID=1872530 RepID=UPI0025C5BA9E|nr:SdpI family protein [Anaerostipes sp.]MBS7009330.1 SdpI family protein [Anaerostipes sp.]